MHHRLSPLAVLVLIGCVAPVGSDLGSDLASDLGADLGTSAQALSSIECSERGDTGYVRGGAFGITVVTVDGRPVERDTANAYYVMAQAASRAGVEIRIVSGFRTMSQQRYLYGCYTSCSCNGCNLAARPGYSNHQSGHALDLNTSAPGVLAWLNANGARYGFRRTVPSEAWHWEWWGGGPGGGPCGRRCTPSCSGSRITSADCGVGDCGTFGATCVDDALGVRCASVFCPPRGDSRVCVSDTVIGHCDDGGISTGDCGAFAAFCSTAGASEARCVSIFCVSDPSEAPRAHDVCLPDGRLAHCNADGAPEDATTCADGTRCQDDGEGGFACLRGGESPVGALDAADCDHLGGWAQDADEPDAPLDVHLWVDGAPGAEGATSFGVRADRSRDDLCDALGSCAHAFEAPTPWALFDGAAHEVRAYGINLHAGGNSELGASPRTLQCDPPLLDGVRRHVRDPQSYAAWRFDDFQDRAPVTDAVIEALPEELALPALARLVRPDGLDDVFLLDGAVRRFVTPEAFDAWRFDEAEVEVMQRDALEAIEEGAPLRARPMLVRLESGAVYLVDDSPLPAEDPDAPTIDDPPASTVEPPTTPADPAPEVGRLRGTCSASGSGGGAASWWCLAGLLGALLFRRRSGARQQRRRRARACTARLPLLALLLGGCFAPVGDLPADDLASVQSSLSSSQRRARATQIRDAAAANGITQGWLLAGIADAETTMAHCHSELTWACRGPYSADCGGPVVAGAGDGPCSARQGGLGMFQFDAGTYDDTLRREGDRVLSVAGNVAAGVDFVVGMVIRSAYVPGVSTRAQAIDWINSVRVGNGRWDAWVRTVTHYYNGCAPSYSCFPSRYARYRDHTSGVFHEMGADFWTPCEATCLDGTHIRGTDCGSGDCAAFGATCVDDSLGARCVSVFCEARGESQGCVDDDVLITCRDGAPVGTGSCGAFGARCVDDALGARCASVFCPDRGVAHACLPDGDTLLTCSDGGIESSGSCGAFGATCVDDELGARCVSVFCEPRGEHTTCVPESEVLLTCGDGGITANVDCAEEDGVCVDDGDGARCVSRHCEPSGTATHCGSADLLLTCTDGDVSGSIDCSEEGGHCAEDAGGARCAVCPDEGRISRCLGDAIVEVCQDGEASAYECASEARCVLDGGIARCVEGSGSTAPAPSEDATEVRGDAPTEVGASALSSGCAVGPGSGPAPLAFLLVFGLLVRSRRRR